MPRRHSLSHGTEPVAEEETTKREGNDFCAEANEIGRYQIYGWIPPDLTPKYRELPVLCMVWKAIQESCERRPEVRTKWRTSDGLKFTVLCDWGAICHLPSAGTKANLIGSLISLRKLAFLPYRDVQRLF